MRAPRPFVTALTGLTTLLLGAAGLVAVAVPATAADTDIEINEIESNDPGVADFVELHNTGTGPVNVSGWIVKDSVDTRTLAIPADTVVQPGAYYAINTHVPGGFGLGQPDAARLYLPGGTTLIDSYSWITHATTTYGRCPTGTGAFVTTSASTRNAANACPPALAAGPWPGGAGVSTVDPRDLLTENLSGLVYEGSGTSAPGTLWAVRNGNASTLYKLQRSGTTWAPASGDFAAGKNLNYPDGTGEPDAEGVTFTDAGSAGGLYVATERNNDANTISRPAILRFDPGAAGAGLNATRDYNLSADLPGLGANLGPEAIAWVPDSYLVANGFVDQEEEASYDPAAYPAHGNGLFFVGVEQTGQVFAYALSETSNAFTRVASFTTGFPGIMELTWEAETQKLWVVCDDTCQGRTSRFGVDTAAGSATRGQFVPGPYYERPIGMGNLNTEGFAVTPATECVDFVKPVFWADDNDTDDFSLRQGTLTCGNPPAPPVTPPAVPPAPPAPPAPVDVTAPSVRVTKVADGRVYTDGVPKPRCRATDASGVSSCRLKRSQRGIAGRFALVTAVATAVDAAGNRATARKVYVVRRR